MPPASGAVNFFRRRWVRRTALILGTVIVLFGLAGYLVLPGVIKSQGEKAVSAALHRKFTIERVDVRPYSLSVSVHGAKLYEADGQNVFASFQDLLVRVSASSVIHLAPVIKELHLTAPFVHLARTGPNRYSSDDIVAALASKPAPAQAAGAKAGGAARFSVYNIRIDGGRFEFDDQPTEAHHIVTDLTLGIPFISSLPSQEEVFVEPLLSATINGSPLLIKGKARPFASTREATVGLDLDRVDLTKYLPYLPFEPRFRMPAAQLDLHLQASFQQPVDRAAAVILSGKAALKSLQLTTINGDPILALPELAVELGKADVFGGRIDVSRIAVNGLQLNVVKDARGQMNLALLAPPAKTEPAPAAESAAAPSGSTPARAGSAMTVSIGQIALQDAALRFGDRSPARPLEAGVEQLDLRIADTTLDLKDRHLAIGRVDSDSARFRLQQGRTEAEQEAEQRPPAAGSAPAATRPGSAAGAHAAGAPSPGDEAPWTFSVGRVAIGNWGTRIESKGLPQLAVTAATGIAIAAEGLSSAAGSSPGKIDLKAKVNRSGSVSVAGALGLEPLHADLALDLKGVDLLALQPYFTDQVNLLITQADLSTRGRLVVDRSGDGSVKGGFRGDATLGNLATIDKVNASDFVNWKALSFGGVDARLAPFSLNIDQITLSDFFARVIVDPSGRINLQDVARKPGEQRSLTSEQPQAASGTAPGAAAEGQAVAASGTTSEAQAPAPGPAAEAQVAPAAPTPAPQTQAATAGTPATPSAPQAALPIRIRQIRLQAGRVRFTDDFIKPNYTANLLDLNGTVSGLSSEADSTAEVAVSGEVNSAPLNIAGTINPIKGDLYLDVKAGVHGMELAPLSPYSGKYVGYGIERGKLSFDVAYHLEHRQLKAENRLVLDQLTFGDKVDSPTATKLPVQLAIALLKDRNGVIDIDLPIGGSLDDPQFSVGAVIVKVVVNLITKAVTAPFALLGSLFGGGEELSFIEYAPGSADVAPAGETRLKALAKALNERPGLKLEIAARVDPDTDREGLRRQSLDRQVRALKVKDLVAKGESATIADVSVSPEEYAALLTRIYQAQQKGAKPENTAKGQPPPSAPDIERLLLAGSPVADEELTALGDRRSQAVKQWLQTNGQVSDQRLFLLATQVGKSSHGTDAGGTSAGPAGKSSRVEFALK